MKLIQQQNNQYNSRKYSLSCRLNHVNVAHAVSVPEIWDTHFTNLWCSRMVDILWCGHKECAKLWPIIGKTFIHDRRMCDELEIFQGRLDKLRSDLYYGPQHLHSFVHVHHTAAHLLSARRDFSIHRRWLIYIFGTYLCHLPFQSQSSSPLKPSKDLFIHQSFLLNSKLH